MNHRVFLTLLVVAVAAVGGAEVPTYTVLELQARAALTGAYNLPDGADIKDQTPQINSAGEVAFKVRALAGNSQGLWFGSAGSGAVVYTGPSGATLSTPSLNDAGRVVFEVNGSGGSDGIHYYDGATGSDGTETAGPAGAQAWESVDINATGNVGYRADFGASASWVGWYPGIPTWVTYVSTGGDYSQLFEPSYNDLNQIGGKVNSVLLPLCHEIRLFNPDTSSTLVGQDANCDDPSTPYQSFDDWVDLVSIADDPDPYVAFVATLASGARAVFLTDGFDNLTPFASTDMPEISAISALPISANNNGLIVFMGADDLGVPAMAVGDGTTLVRVVTQGDEISTDLGLARITQFEGSATISESDEIAFNVSIESAATAEDWGTAVFVARASLFSDGFESGGTERWSTTVP